MGRGRSPVGDAPLLSRSPSPPSRSFPAARTRRAPGSGPSLRHLSHPGFKGPSSICRPLSLLSMGAVCVPYLIRFVQCLTVYRSTGNTSQVRAPLRGAVLSREGTGGRAQRERSPGRVERAGEGRGGRSELPASVQS